MLLSEALRRARELYLAGKHRLSREPELLDHASLLLDAALDNVALAAEALELLDRLVPGGNFHFWLDGGSWGERRLYGWGPVYRLDRRPTDVASVLGRAELEAKRRES